MLKGTNFKAHNTTTSVVATIKTNAQRINYVYISRLGILRIPYHVGENSKLATLRKKPHSLAPTHDKKAADF